MKTGRAVPDRVVYIQVSESVKNKQTGKLERQSSKTITVPEQTLIKVKAVIEKALATA